MDSRIAIPHHTSRGFTLIEVVAAMVIVALMAGLAGLSLHGVLHSAQNDQATRKLLAYDEQARRRAVRFDQPIRLNIRENRIDQELTEHTGAARTRDVPAMSSMPGLLPAGYEIEHVITADGDDTQAEVVVTPSAGMGRSRSYGLRLIEKNAEQEWVIVCGPTGMGVVLDNDRQAQDILAILSRARLPGSDAD